MSLWIEVKYASLITGKVRNFKRVSSNLWNMSCPLCGDSDKDQKKARGYIYQKNTRLKYHCHNCSANMLFDNFLKELDEGLYHEMRKESLIDYKENNQTKRIVPDAVAFAQKMKKPEFVKKLSLAGVKKVSSLPHNHFCKKYIDSRKIPTYLHHQLFFCEKFKEWTNTLLPDKFTNIVKDEPRLIIPFLNKSETLFGYQGRSFKKDDPVKYITIMLDENHSRIYGLDKADFNHRYYAVEGPIDAMFVKNCVASAGSDIVSELEKMGANKDNAVIIYDNEPRNSDTVKKINRAIRKGYKVVIWPDSIREKDVNDMFLSGLPLMEIINQNIYYGLEAKLRMTQWTK